MTGKEAGDPSEPPAAKRGVWSRRWNPGMPSGRLSSCELDN